MQKQVRLIEFEAPFVESFYNIIFATFSGFAITLLVRVILKPEEGIGVVLVVLVTLIAPLSVGCLRYFRLRRLVRELEQALNEGGSEEGDRR